MGVNFVKDIFEESIPEKQGISSRCICDFINALYKRNITMHSILLFRNNRLLFEGYYKPFEKDTLHRMFSITKSFVSAAVGVLCGKGILSLDKPIIYYFPEYCSEATHRYSKEVTIRDLLRMESQHNISAFRQSDDKDYVRAFFSVPPTKVPGTVFSYESSAAHTLSALVEKLGEKPLMDFLKDEFLRDAGFSESSYCITDPMGRSKGDSGLMATPTDIGIFAHIFLNDGRVCGRQVILSDYVRSAVSFQTDTSVKGSFRAEKYGYGYLFWMQPYGGYMCYGLGGQLGVVIPQKNIVLVTTADTMEQKSEVGDILDEFYKRIVQNAKDEPLPTDIKAFSALEDLKNNLAVSALKNDRKNTENINAVYSMEPNAFGIKSVSLSLCKDEGSLFFNTDSESLELPVGLGKNKSGKLPFYNYSCISSMSFKGKGDFLIKTQVTDEETSPIYMQLRLNDKGIGTLMTKTALPDVFGIFNTPYIIKGYEKITPLPQMKI